MQIDWHEHGLVQNGGVVSILAWQHYDWLRQGFSLKTAGNISERFGETEESRKKITEILGLEPKQWMGMEQVHGSRIVEVHPDSDYTETDGLITDKPGQLLAVVVADCVPLLFVDPVCRRIAVAHAGRRGTQLEIAKLTFKELIKHGSRAQDVQVAIGPSIGPCCYEVDPETHEVFDLWRHNEEQLRQVGASTIIRTDVCTKDHNDMFFSHRADDVEGRFAGLMGIA